jgi:hypothetical protein
VEVVKAQLGTTGTNVVNTAGQLFLLAFKSGACRDYTLGAILLDVTLERLGDMELVRVGVGILSLLEVLDLSGSKFVVLLGVD